MLGAFVGSVAGKLVESTLKGSLGEEAEAELIGRLQEYEAAAIDELDESLRAAIGSTKIRGVKVADIDG